MNLHFSIIYTTVVDHKSFCAKDFPDLERNYNLYTLETLKKEEVSYPRRHTQQQRVRPVDLTFDLIRNLTTTEAKKSRSELGDEELKVFPNVHQQSK